MNLTGFHQRLIYVALHYLKVGEITSEKMIRGSQTFKIADGRRELHIRKIIISKADQKRNWVIAA